jgi:hypothetical protein
MRILDAIRAAFAVGQYQTVLSAFDQLGDFRAVRSGIRVEAIALAARAHTAMGDTTAARQLLKQVWNAELKHHRHYRHVAHACLDLGEYRRAVALSEKAAELAEAARKPQTGPMPPT